MKLTKNALGMILAKYCSVLAKMRSKSASLLLVSCLLLPNPVLAGETIVYDGDPAMLREDPLSAGDPDSLVPDTSSTDNSVTVNAPVPGSVYGGFGYSDSDTAVATNNTVAINDAGAGNVAIGGAAYGGSGSADASNNILTVDNSEVSQNAVGGYAFVDGASAESKITAINNTLIINGAASEVSFAFGGYAATSTTPGSGNGVSLANGNMLIINDGTVGIHVNGGYAVSNFGTSEASGNTVIVNNSQVIGGDVFGGFAVLADMHTYGESATASGNSVIFNNGVAGLEVMVDDRPTLSGGNVMGGNAFSNMGPVTATRNTVTQNGGDMGYIYGGSALTHSDSFAAATHNAVIINGGRVGIMRLNGEFGYGNAIGGIAGSGDSDNPGESLASDNSVTVNNGAMNSVIGGNAEAPGTSTATAINNTVTINGGTINWNVFGGYAASSDGTTIASGNTVKISGGTFNGEDIYGGFISSHDGTAQAINNTVTLSGSPVFGANITLYGGMTADELDGDFFTGNTLNVLNYTGTSVKGVENFQYYNFLIPANQSSPVLTITDSAILGSDAKDSIITVSTSGASAPLQVGGKVRLIEGDVTGSYQDQATGTHGVLLRYDWLLEDSENGLVATLNNIKGNEQAKSLSEGKISGTLSLLQGQDTIANQGIINAAQVAGGNGTNPFAAIGYENSRYKTGSHIDTSGWSLVSGAAKGKEYAEGGKRTHGFFVEYGHGNYDTYNSFAAGEVNGNSNTKYYGVGALLRKEGKNDGAGYNYHEGSLRIGRVTTDYSAVISGILSGYDSSSTYYGAHYGFGRVQNKANGATLDIYGKLLYTHQNGSDLTLTSGDSMHFSGINSYRARAGMLYTTAPAKSGTTFSYGLAYEYEFGGKQNASSHGVSLDAPSLKGSSAIGTIGMNYKQRADSNFTLGLNLSGYAGKRQGLGCSAQLKWAF